MTTKPKLLLTAAALIVVGLFGAAATFNKDKSTTITKEKTLDESFASVQIKADDATIRLLPTKEKQAKIELTSSKRKLNNTKLKVQTDNSMVKITTKPTLRPFINFNVFDKGLHLTLYLPEKQYNKISAFSDNGKVIVKDLKAKDFSIGSNNGKVQLTRLKATNIATKVDNGKIELTNNHGKIKAISDNGKIELTAPTLEHDTNLETDNGSIHVQLKTKPTKLSIEAEVDNGSIHVFNKKYSSHVTNIIQNGPLLQLKTDNGSIRVEEK